MLKQEKNLIEQEEIFSRQGILFFIDMQTTTVVVFE